MTSSGFGSVEAVPVSYRFNLTSVETGAQSLKLVTSSFTTAPKSEPSYA